MILFEKLLANVAKKPKFVHFDDPEAERIFIENWDKDGDGKISIQEAHNVDHIGYKFRNNTKIIKLNVLCFTQLSGVNNSTFAGMTALEELSLPGSVKLTSYFLGGWEYSKLPSVKKLVIKEGFTIIIEGTDDNVKDYVEYPSTLERAQWAQPRLNAKCTVIKAKTPPIIDKSAFSGKGNLYVPDESVQTYKTTFSRISERIFPLSECEYK